ncbi:MAG: hypothetical protein CM15mV35_490 [uncultured marine virus]|nr:MAG: hypothetical protein CM15mV35_490 [uncultured marine virus]
MNTIPRKGDAGDDDDDYVPPKHGNKNAKAVESMGAILRPIL